MFTQQPMIGKPSKIDNITLDLSQPILNNQIEALQR